ncbi:MAG: cob(I)yrinic acid a,c-diamide adenosyltransferase [Candidatus Saccharibacteria bacterium]
MHGHSNDMQASNKREDRGLVIVLTGNGKGKTTSAMGQAMRALGHNCRVLLIQFLKHGEFGEIKAISRLPNIDIMQFGREQFVDPKNPHQDDYKYAEQGMRAAQEAVTRGDYDMVILDEINVALHFGLIKAEQVTSLIKDKRPGINLILTGRHALPEVIKLADTVSEIEDIKHHSELGAKARAGIEF